MKDLTDPNKRADTFSWMMKRGVKQSDRIVVEDCGIGRRLSAVIKKMLLFSAACPMGDRTTRHPRPRSKKMTLF